MQVPHGEPELEKREAAYLRHDVTISTSHHFETPVSVHVYAVPDDLNSAADVRHPIYLSYIDVVCQGYFREFGSAGVQHFFETTDGWETDILDDRHDPQYPRHQSLDHMETKLTDDWIARLPAVVKKL